MERLKSSRGEISSKTEDFEIGETSGEREAGSRVLQSHLIQNPFYDSEEDITNNNTDNEISPCYKSTSIVGSEDLPDQCNITYNVSVPVSVKDENEIASDGCPEEDQVAESLKEPATTVHFREPIDYSDDPKVLMFD